MTKPSVVRCFELHERHFPHSKLLLAQPDVGRYAVQLIPCPKREHLDQLVFRDTATDLDGREPFEC